MTALVGLRIGKEFLATTRFLFIVCCGVAAQARKRVVLGGVGVLDAG
jgi:hypothetical protein